MIPANQKLVSLFIDQHNAIIAVFRFSFIVPIKNDADRIIRPVFALKNIPPHAGSHIRNVAQLSFIGRKRNKIVSLPVVFGEIEAFFRMKRCYRTERIGIVNGKAVYGKISVFGRIEYRHLGMVAEHLNAVSFRGHLIRNGFLFHFFGGIVTSETCPINHASGRAFEQNHYFRFRLVAKLVLLKVRHHLVGDKMHGAGILGHFGLKRTCAGTFRLDFCRCRCNEKPVTVETEQGHVLHTATIGVHRTGVHYFHIGNIRTEPQCHIPFRNIRRRVEPLILLARNQQDSYGCHGHNRMYQSLKRILFHI